MYRCPLNMFPMTSCFSVPELPMSRRRNFFPRFFELGGVADHIVNHNLYKSLAASEMGCKPDPDATPEQF